MSTDAKLKALRDSWIADRASMFDYMLEICESPIERLFLSALLADAPSDEEDAGWMAWGRVSDQTRWPAMREWAARVYGIKKPVHMFVQDSEGADERFWSIVVPQASVQLEDGAFRVDFALLSRSSKVAIELDGHDFHERTKEQAKRDKRRDRALTKAGWRVIRFTGSEVYADPRACINEAIELQSSLHVRLPVQSR